MTISPEYRRMAVDALCKTLLEDVNPKIRAKAAESLGKLGSEDGIPALCQAWLQDSDINVRFVAADALVIILNPESIQPMSETPKFDLRGAQIGNLADTVKGDQITNQYNYASEQNLAEAATQIQQLLNQLAQTNPTTNEVTVANAIQQEIKQNPTLKQRLRSALKAGGIEALKAIFNHPLVSIPIETIKGWVEAE